MAKTILVGPDIELGEVFLQRLDAARYPVSVVGWVLNEDEFGEWRLLLGSPLDDRNPREAMHQLRLAVTPSEPNLFIRIPFSLRGNRSPLIKALRARFKKDTDNKGMRVRLQSFGDFWIDDSYFYRIR